MSTRTLYTPVASEVLTAANLRKFASGWVGDATVTANQTGITTEAAITGLATSPTIPSDRKIKVTVCCHVQSDTTGDRWRVRVKADGTTLQDFRNPDCTANLADTAQFTAFHTPSAGTVAYTVTVERSSGTGTLTVAAAATTPATLLVEDIGPSS